MSEFDEAAEAAEKDLRENYDDNEIYIMAKWWKEHYLKAGHKRLGRVLLKVAKEKNDD
jgi:hypothetical protein